MTRAQLIKKAEAALEKNEAYQEHVKGLEEAERDFSEGPHPMNARRYHLGKVVEIIHRTCDALTAKYGEPVG